MAHRLRKRDFHEVGEDPHHLLDQLVAVVDNPPDEGLENSKEKDVDHRHNLEVGVALPAAYTVDYLESVLPNTLKEAGNENETETQTGINTAHTAAMNSSKTATIVLGDININKDLIEIKETHN